MPGLRSLLSGIAIGTLVAASATCAAEDPQVSRGDVTFVTSSAPAAPATTGNPASTTGSATPPTTPAATFPPGSIPPGAPEYGLGDSMFPGLGAPGIDVGEYDVTLRYDPGGGELEGRATVSLRTTAALDTVALDAGARIEVASVTVDGVPAEHHHDGGELIVELARSLAAGTPVELGVTWRARVPEVVSVASWAPAGWFGTDGGSFVLDEPDGLSTWMPANDHPSDTARWRVTIDVPAGLTGVSNGQLIGHERAGDRETWTWALDSPMASYLVLVLTGDYELIDGEGPHGLPLHHAVPPRLVDQARRVIDATPDMITFFEDWFGPFPFSTYGIAVTDRVMGVAMEYQSRSLFGAGTLTEDVAAHELTHQWFGDAVTLADWGDVWLNEGFATYGAWLWQGRSDPAALDALAEQALDTPRAFPPTEPSPELFTPEVYEGGAVVLQALRGELGEDAFRALLRRWAEEPAGAPRTTEEFVAAAEAVAGRDLGAFFDAWLFTADPPDVYPA